jgi:hypothetical protein
MLKSVYAQLRNQPLNKIRAVFIQKIGCAENPLLEIFPGKEEGGRLLNLSQ